MTSSTTIKSYLATLVIVGFWAGPAASFQDIDLEAVGKRAQSQLGPNFLGSMGRGNKSVTIGCASCTGLTMVTMSIGRQTDGTEERVRSGQTTMADLERQCQANEPTCRVTRADVGGAVGWLTSYASGRLAGNTHVLVLNGDMLIVRSMADKSKTARDNMLRMQRSIIPEIISR